MTKADIIASVGRDRYDAASRILKKLATGPNPDLPHVVSPAVWDLPLPHAAHHDPRTIEAILRVSGPVPWPLKAPLYQAAAQDASWHMALLQALVGSAFDVFGSIELEPARHLVAQLQLPADAPGLAELKTRVSQAGP